MQKLTNEELRIYFENKAVKNYRITDQISKDINQTADSMKVDQDDPSFLEHFWANYCPEDDGNDWVREG